MQRNDYTAHISILWIIQSLGQKMNLFERKLNFKNLVLSYIFIYLFLYFYFFQI